MFLNVYDDDDDYDDDGVAKTADDNEDMGDGNEDVGMKHR